MRLQLNLYKYINVFLSISLLLVGGFVNNAVYYTICTILYWIIGIIYSCRRIKERFSLFAFNIGYFVFLISGYSYRLITNGDFSYFSNSYFTSTNDANIHACRSLFISLLFINCTYILIKRKEADDGELSPPVVPVSVQQLLLIMMITSFACKLAGGIEQIMIVRAVTYYESGQYLSSLPAIIIHISSLFYISSFLYLATFPSKRMTIISMSLVIINGIVCLICGERGEPISILFVIILYIGVRNRFGINDIIIKRKYVVVTIILLPIIMFGLQMMSYTRNNSSYEATLGQGIQDFFESQGGSVRIIANSYDLHDKIEDMGGHTFVVGEVRYYFKNNIIARLITGRNLSLRTIEDAFSGDNFLRTYGYAYAPVTYTRFVGAGSTYIAEVYHDGGYILLALISILYAFLLSKIDTIKVKTFIMVAIYLNIFRYVPTLPRGMALDWLTNTFAVQNLLLYGIIYVAIKNSNKKINLTQRMEQS